MIEKISLLVGAYLLGSIPFGYIIVKLSSGIDVRQVGSGNIGATNVLRASSRWAAIVTLLLDGAKGYVAVALARLMIDDPSRTWEAAAAAAAISGHIFTIFLRFRGGKGVATGCGAFLAIAPRAVLATLVLFVIVVALSRYVSLGSIVAAAAFPLWLYFYSEPTPVLIGGILGAAMIIAKHHGNIRRLIEGTERVFAIRETGPRRGER